MSNWFIALKVDPVGWFDALPATPEGVTLEHPSDLHVTLGFYGPNEAAAREGFEVAKRAFARSRSCSLRPDAKRSRR